ncbi:MAG: hypothetical protein KIT34_12105 [Cyanobacteria bacterium TGS_CYA1]|nr:hypothetical protein [Cyanobacteria bacterium TGS_CYA1]
MTDDSNNKAKLQVGVSRSGVGAGGGSRGGGKIVGTGFDSRGSDDSEPFLEKIPFGKRYIEIIFSRVEVDPACLKIVEKAAFTPVLPESDRIDLFTRLWIGSAEEIKSAREELHEAYLQLIIWVLSTFLSKNQNLLPFLDEAYYVFDIAVDTFPVKRYEGYPHFGKHAHWVMHNYYIRWRKPLR